MPGSTEGHRGRAPARNPFRPEEGIQRWRQRSFRMHPAPPQPPPFTLHGTPEPRLFSGPGPRPPRFALDGVDGTDHDALARWAAEPNPFWTAGEVETLGDMADGWTAKPNPFCPLARKEADDEHEQGRPR